MKWIQQMEIEKRIASDSDDWLEESEENVRLSLNFLFFHLDTWKYLEWKMPQKFILRNYDTEFKWLLYLIDH